MTSTSKTQRFLTKVTITGADDATSTSDLSALSGEFPFVEWGILLSAKKQGHARYPSPEWQANFSMCDVQKALHVCGKLAADLMAGHRGPMSTAVALGAARVQVNGWKPAPALDLAAVDYWFHYEFILQARDFDSFVVAACHAATTRQYLGKASVLWDPSGGRGIRGAFSLLPGRGLVGALTAGVSAPVGYAGGIGPDNISEVLAQLSDRGPCWIDMESNVRTNDRLDLDKVRAVLEAAAPHVLP